MSQDNQLVKLKKADFESEQEVKWCPGCGDYAILATLQRFLPQLDIPREKHAIISGIGCSSRFPYYMNTYGFHTIHGRAPAIATGLKVSRPDLNVWIVTGDGDALSIGGNHLMHLMRRNVNVNVLLFNNKIYGLTKGQYSPTSEFGKKTKSTPYGSLDTPVNAASFCLSAGATFIARALATDVKGLTAVLDEAQKHDGVSFIEIYQNCNVFNDGAFDDFADRKVKKERQLELAHGKPLVYGDEVQKGLTLDGLKVTTKEVTDPSQAIEHDVYDKSLAFMLTQLPSPEFPVPLGVLYKEERPSYDALMSDQIEQARAKSPGADLDSLLRSGDTWTVS